MSFLSFILDIAANGYSMGFIQTVLALMLAWEVFQVCAFRRLKLHFHGVLSKCVREKLLIHQLTLCFHFAAIGRLCEKCKCCHLLSTANVFLSTLVKIHIEHKCKRVYLPS